LREIHCMITILRRRRGRHWPLPART
jgi:hypothetical protein